MNQVFPGVHNMTLSSTVKKHVIKCYSNAAKDAMLRTQRSVDSF